MQDDLELEQQDAEFSALEEDLDDIEDDITEPIEEDLFEPEDEDEII